MFRSRAIALLAACLAVMTGCTTNPAMLDEPVTRTTTPATPDTGSQIARAALDVLGTPYRYGGNDRNGFDCSGLVQYAHSQAGISIPRTTSVQFTYAPVKPDSLQVGDVLFFKVAGHISHNGIYLGNGRFIHAPSTGKNVTIARTDNPYFQKRLAAIARYH